MKIKKISNIWLPRFLLCVSISLIISAKGLGQPTATISGTTTVCQDAPPPNITFTGANGTPPYTFTYTINSGTFQSVSTTSGNIVTVSVPTGTPGTFTYDLISVSDAIFGSQAASGTAVVTINPTLAVSVSIAASATTICAGTGVTFTATPTNGGTIPSYQWKVNGINAGTDSPFFTSTTLSNNDLIGVVLTSNAPCNSGPAISNTVTMTVNPVLAVSVSISPSANNVCTGASVTFTATPVNGGGAPAYQWKVNNVNSGPNNSTFTYIPSNGDIVTCVLTSDALCTTGNPATSSPITMIVTAPLTPAVSIAAVPAGAICAGTSVTFTATPTNGGIPSYQWKINGANAGTDSPDFTSASLNNNDVVSVTMTSSLTCVTSSLAVSNIITMAVNPLPVPTLISSDADNSFCQGTSVTFTASGGTGYDFRVGAISVQNGASNIYTTTFLTNGQVVSVIVTNASGCSATSAGITNIVHPLPIPTITSSAVGNTSCQGVSVTFTASGGSSYNFRVDGLSVKNSAIATYTTSSLTNGQVVDVIVTNLNGCSATSAGLINIVNSQPIANAGTGGNTCGLGFHLNGTMNIGTGTWAKVSGPGIVSFSPNATTANALATVTAFGTYTFSWTVLNGTCSNSANVSVVFIQEIPANGGSGGEICGKSFTLNAIAPTNGIGTWSKYSGPGNATFAPDIHQTVAKVTVDQFGIYDFAWTVVSGSCSSSDNVRVVFHDVPSINAGRDTAMCKGGGVQLRAAGIGSVSWTPVKLLSNPNILNPIASPDTTTKFTVHLTDQFGCKNADSTIVEVRKRIVADAGPDQVLNSVFSTKLAARLAHSYEKGIWSIISGTGKFNDSTNATTVVSGLSRGINKLFWTVTNGYCPPSGDTTNISVIDFVIPTMITPNMDGRNDYFIVGGLTNQSKTELLIFDRRGVQVYKNLNYDNSWNGVDYNKNPLPDDTYFYVLKYAEGKSYRGYIVIRR